MKKSYLHPSRGWAWLVLSLGVLVVSIIQSVSAPVITEFLAADKNRLADEEGGYPGWIEISNPDSVPLDLNGWYLTDDAANLTKWRSPSTLVPVGCSVVVFASGKNRATTGQPLHTNFRLKQDGGYLALVQPNGTTVASVYANFPPQFENTSFGTQPGGSAVGYLALPTPGAPNTASSFTLPIAPLVFSPAPGVYDNSVNVSISCATPGVTISYTLDGSVPGAGNPSTIAYTPGGSINAVGTKIIRVVASAANYQTTPVITRSYISLATVRQQPANPPGFPATWSVYPNTYGYPAVQGQPRPASYSVNPGLVANNTTHLNQDLKDLPTLSIVGNVQDFFGISGFYANPWGTHGKEWERPASVEFFSKLQAGQTPQGPQFQVNCGIRIKGGGSREPKLAKHGMRLYFRQEYGTDRLRYQLFPRDFEAQNPSPANAPEFGRLALHGYINDGWSWEGGSFGHGTFLRDIWARDTHAEMGRFASKGSFAHLYLNGLYWGLYQIGEQAEPVTLASRMGGLPEDYDVVGADDEIQTVPAISVEHGSYCAWSNMWNTVNTLNSNPADSTLYANLGQNLDMDSFIDYMILNFYAVNYDWPHKNWFAFRQRVPGGKFHFAVWDAEWTMDTDFFVPVTGDVSDDGVIAPSRPGGTSPGSTNNKNYNNSPVRIFDILSGSPTFTGGNPAFKAAFANRLQRHLFNNGALSLARCQSRWDKRYNEIYTGMVGETIRYGVTRFVPDPYWATIYTSELFTRDTPWIGHCNNVRNNFFPQRSGSTGYFITQMRQHNLFPTRPSTQSILQGPNVTASFVFQIPSDPSEGRVGGSLTLAASADYIVYTTDGSDPMTSGIQSVPPVVFNQWTSYATLRARAKVGNSWSPIVEARLAPNTATLLAPQYVRTTANGVDTVTLLNPNGQGRIYYTLDGSDPGINGFTADPRPGARDYVGPIQITRSVKLRARVHLPNYSIDSNFRGGALLSVDLSPTYPMSPAQNYSGLQITEIMYDPNGDDALYEFLELKNTGPVTLDLSGLKFTDGIDYSFPCGATLVPNQFFVIARSSASTFQTRYGRLPDGVYFGALANEGERITLETSGGQNVFSFTYGIASPWPVVGNTGFSIVRTGDLNDPALSSSWRLSSVVNGSIGTDDNAVVAHGLGREFSVASNPSPGGRWSYGYMNALGGAFATVTVPYTGSTADDGTVIPSWQYSAYQTPAFYVNNAGRPLTLGGGALVMEADDVWFYPGDDAFTGNYGVIRYRVGANEAGRYQILSLVRAVYPSWFTTGDTDFHVLRNGVEIHGNQLPGGGSEGFSTTISLAANDTIDFVIGRGADGSSYASGLKIRAFLQKVQSSGALDPAHSVNTEFTPASNTAGQRWQYGSSPCLAPVNFGLVTVPFQSQADDFTVIPSWQLSSSQTPAFYWNNANHTLTTGGIATFVPGTIWFYPGDDGLAANYGVIRYTVPAGEGGLYSLAAVIESTYLAFGAGDTDFHIIHNGNRLESRAVPADGWALLPRTMQVSAGDTIDFVVGRGADGTAYASGLKLWMQFTRLP